MSKFLWILVPLLVIQACGKKSDSNPPSPSNPVVKETIDNSTAESKLEDVVEVSEVRLKDLVLKVDRKVEMERAMLNLSTFQKNINNYVVTITSVSGSYKGAEVNCNKAIFNQQNNLKNAVFNEQGTEAMLEVSIEPTDPNMVVFKCSIQSNSNTSETKEFALYKSFIVEDEQTITSLGINNEMIETILFLKKSTLTTNGEYLDLTVKNIYSVGGKIQTFSPENAIKNDNNLKGVSGGSINIHALNSFGRIYFDLRGQNGGQQSEIPAKNTSIIPADSALNGVCGGSKHTPSDSWCNGKKGHPGHKGAKGFPGFRGGDTAELKIVVSKDANLDVHFELTPGRGSVGGRGGEGGPGGPGGIGANVKWSTYHGCGREGACNERLHQIKFVDGPTGDQGPRGDQGSNGKDGNIFEPVIQLGTRMSK